MYVAKGIPQSMALMLPSQKLQTNSSFQGRPKPGQLCCHQPQISTSTAAPNIRSVDGDVLAGREAVGVGGFVLNQISYTVQALPGYQSKIARRTMDLQFLHRSYVLEILPMEVLTHAQGTVEVLVRNESFLPVTYQHTILYFVLYGLTHGLSWDFLVT